MADSDKDNPESFYIVEKVLKWALRDNEDGLGERLFYYVAWQGYPAEEENTWEPPEHMKELLPLDPATIRARMRADPWLKETPAELEARAERRRSGRARKKAEAKKRVADKKRADEEAAAARGRNSLRGSPAIPPGRSTRNSRQDSVVSRDWVAEVSKDRPELRSLVPDSPPRRNALGELTSSSETGSPDRESASDAAPSTSAKPRRSTRANPAPPVQQADVEVDLPDPEFVEDAEDAEPVVPRDVESPHPPVEDAEVTFAEDSDDVPDYEFADDSEDDVLAVSNQHPTVPAPLLPAVEEYEFAEDSEDGASVKFAEDSDEDAMDVDGPAAATAASAPIPARAESPEDFRFAEDDDEPAVVTPASEDIVFAEDDDDDDPAPPQPAPAAAAPAPEDIVFAEDEDDDDDTALPQPAPGPAAAPAPPPPAPAKRQPRRRTISIIRDDTDDDDNDEPVQTRPRPKRTRAPKRNSEPTTAVRREDHKPRTTTIVPGLGKLSLLSSYRIPKHSDAVSSASPLVPGPSRVSPTAVAPPPMPTQPRAQQQQPTTFQSRYSVVPSYPLAPTPQPIPFSAPRVVPAVAPSPTVDPRKRPRPPAPNPARSTLPHGTNAEASTSKLAPVVAKRPQEVDPFNNGVPKRTQSRATSLSTSSKSRVSSASSASSSRGRGPPQRRRHNNWVYAPKKDLSLKELDDLRYPKDKAVAVDASVKDLKPKEVSGDYMAVQLILEASASKQAKTLGEGVEVVYVHATEAGEIGKQGGTLADLERFRAAPLELRTFYVFGGKVPTFKSFWSVHAAITISPAAFSVNPNRAVQFFEKTCESRKLWPARRDVFAWAPAAFILKTGPFFFPPLGHLKRDAFSINPPVSVLAMHDLLRTEVVSLVVPTIESGPSCAEMLFPALNDKFRYAEPTLRLLEERGTPAMLESDVTSIQRQAVFWRSKYIQMRRWIVVVTADEQKALELVPGVELLTMDEAARALGM